MTAIAVCGSLNADHIVEVERLPMHGETIMGSAIRRLSGGKGGNQAHAAARVAGSGVRVRMIGRVGADEVGDMMRRDLSDSGADVSGVLASELPSGVALITVGGDGSNTIVVAPGANWSWPEPLSGIEELQPGDIVLLQLEIPLDAVAQIAAAARERGALVVLNAAPANLAARSLLSSIDVLIVNEIEAEQLLGLVEPSAPAVKALPDLPCDLVVTRGPDGCIVAEASGTVHEIGALPIEAIDTVGAGDAFVGALVAALADGAALAEAARVGSAAGGMTATAPGPRHPDLNREAVLALAGDI